MKNVIAEMKSQQKGWKSKGNKTSEMEYGVEEIRKLEDHPGDSVSESLWGLENPEGRKTKTRIPDLPGIWDTWCQMQRVHTTQCPVQ